MEILTVLIRRVPVYIMGMIFFYKIFSHSEKTRYNATKMIVLLVIILYIARVVTSIFNMKRFRKERKYG